MDNEKFQASQNTDVEIWRRKGNGPGDPDNFYQPSIKITKDQGVMICVGGTCITKPIEKWFELAWFENHNPLQQPPADSEVEG